MLIFERRNAAKKRSAGLQDRGKVVDLPREENIDFGGIAAPVQDKLVLLRRGSSRKRR
jgi:hypothetical protein